MAKRRDIVIEPSRRATFSAPMWIRECVDLTLNEKYLLEEVYSFRTTKEGFFASNAWLAVKMGVSEGTVSNIISALHRRGYLWRKIDQSAEHTRHLGLVNEYENPVTDDKGAVHSKMESLSTPELKAVHSRMVSPINDILVNRGEGSKTPPPEFKEGTTEHNAQFRWRHTREQLEAQPEFPDDFLDFFEDHVLGLWNKYKVGVQTAKLWHNKLWVKYSSKLIAEALIEYASVEKAWTPKFPLVLAMCVQLQNKQKAADQAKELQENQSAQKDVDKTSAFDNLRQKYTDMTDEQVLAQYNDENTTAYYRYEARLFRPDVFGRQEVGA